MHPESLGRYQVLELIAKGGMGEVYKALDPSLGRAVAIKVLRGELAADEHRRNLLMREAQAAAALSHPHIVPIYDIGVAEDRVYVCMQLVPGGSLHERLRHGALDLAEAERLLSQLAEAVDHAHSKGVIHRDIKPANVLLDERGDALLSDFSISRMLAAPDEEIWDHVFAGTPMYSAPEAFEGDVGKESDLYSLGVVAFEMLTGSHPYARQESVRAWMQAHATELPPDPRAVRADIPKRTARAVRKLMAKKPADRFGSASAFVDRAFGRAGPDRTRKRSLLGRLTGVLRKLVDPAPARGVTPAQPAPEASGRATPKRTEHTPVPPPRTPVPAMGETVACVPPSTSEIAVVSREAGSLPVRDSGDATMLFAPIRDPEERRHAASLAFERAVDPRFAGTRAEMTAFPFTIGRTDDNDLSIPDTGISRRHCQVVVVGSAFWLEDLASANGTFVNGRKVTRRTPLQLGDSIRLSRDTELRFLTEARPLADITGTRVDARYQLQHVLHTSIKSSTYRATDTKLGQPVIVKVFNPDLTTEAFAKSLEAEAQTMAALKHPNICRVLDFGTTALPGLGDAPFLVREDMKGGDLASRLDGPSEVSRARGWIEQIGEALDYAHGEHIVHAGLKPRSVLFDHLDRPCVADFAGARTSGPLAGSPAFLAPEQWNGEEVTPLTDQYSLAALSYLLFTGVRPYEGQERPEIRESNLERGPIPAHEKAARVDVQLPPAVSAVLMQAMRGDPKGRFASVRDYLAALRSAFCPVSKGDPRVFVSYQRQASAGWAVLIARELREKHGIEAFVDTQQRDGAVQFPDRIRKQIADCSVFVCLLADSTLQSNWVREEIRLAHDNRKPMIPVFQESWEPPDPRTIEEASLLAMLNYNGVHLLDKRNLMIDHSIRDLADIVGREIERRD